MAGIFQICACFDICRYSCKDAPERPVGRVPFFIFPPFCLSRPHQRQRVVPLPAFTSSTLVHRRLFIFLHTSQLHNKTCPQWRFHCPTLLSHPNCIDGKRTSAVTDEDWCIASVFISSNDFPSSNVCSMLW